MDIPNLPERLSPEQLEWLRQLGESVRQVLENVGLPVTFHPDPYVWPTEAVGAHIYLDPLGPDFVGVRWESKKDLSERALAASRARDYDNKDLRLKVNAQYALGEAIARILKEAGFETGIGVDMAPADIWAKPRSEA